MSNSRLVARVGALAVAAAVISGSGLARAAEPGPDTQPLNVIAIQGNDADDQAEALTKALRNAVRQSGGWSLSPGDYSMEVLVLSMKCSEPPDPACQAKIADEIHVDRYIWGYLKKPKGSSNVTGELALWVRGKGTTKIPIEYSANLTEANEDALKRVANDALNRLTGGAPKGGVHVKAGVEGGQLFLDGEPLGALAGGEITLQVPSGTHKLTVKAPGFDDSETQVFIKPGKTSDVTVSLNKSTPKTGMSGRAIGGLAMMGGGVLLLGAGGVVGLVQVSKNSAAEKIDQPYGLVQSLSGNGQTPCDNAKKWDANNGSIPTDKNGKPLLTGTQAKAAVSTCSTNSTLTTMQLILYPAGAVIGGIGIYLFVTAPSSKPAPAAAKQKPWSLEPMVGFEGGKLDFKYRF